MPPLNLSKAKFTNKADKVYSDDGIFHPEAADIKTLAGADEIIGNNFIDSDFGFGAFVGVKTKNAGAIAAVDLSGKATVEVNGIHNKGNINTNQGRDVIQGKATAKITAIAQTVSEAIACANKLDADAIAKIFASIDIKAIANGIKNSGEINTGKGSDTIEGDVTASVAAVATAIADATAIVKAVSQAPMGEGLTAFAQAIAKSLAKASVIATGINNTGGKITTAKGADTISASATSYSATYSEASSYTLASATPENKALALAVADAVAKTEDIAIALDNTRGYIDLGKGSDTINATAKGSDKAIAIKNTQGNIHTGDGNDTIKAYATGLNSYGIFGGNIHTGNGDDRIEASSFGGGVNIDMGNGKDFVAGFGNATINGGSGFDIFSFGSYNLGDFKISFGANHNQVVFERNDIIMTTTKFEQFNFDNGNLTLTYNQLVATV